MAEREAHGVPLPAAWLADIEALARGETPASRPDQ